jgi:type 1 fimbriae regulatory protein FimB/type 1 fimbriae regulatory protein FimE
MGQFRLVASRTAKTRDREHLTEAEVERLIKAAGKNRYGRRDATMILIAFRHGLRPIEVCTLAWRRRRRKPA